MANLEANWESATRGVYRTAFPGALFRHHIAPRDIGRIVAEAFDDPDGWIGRELDIAGHFTSYAGIAAAMRRQIGRPVVYEQIPWEDYTATATSTAIAREAWYLANPVSVDMDALHEEFPWLMTVEEYLIDAGWAER